MTLLEQFNNTRSSRPDELNLRLHRAFSWITKAQECDDKDIQFISLWIAFNAVYARKMGLNITNSEKAEFRRFIQMICQLDKVQAIYNLVWDTYSGSIRTLLDNRYTFQPFWDFHNSHISEQAWLEDFKQAKSKVHVALTNKDTDIILAVVFERLYTLRNQIVHGGATHNSQVNREQVKDGCAILSSLLPLMIQIMMSHHDQMDWGKPFYPVVN
ncbi:HEPN domain-containing protein [Psychrobacter sp. I-STPA6b]|uniref:HEPN domain-containing protein n=1 Tax=Psychrobacter sp. I-STPA6b TaxID=2585718 RepID=UPI001D0C2A93|nr:HEPN domain-containing protein [Psychrobacter sp. I-STPA6b]